MLGVNVAPFSYFGSGIFHWFNPVSMRHHWRLRLVDFIGISVHIIGVSVSPWWVVLTIQWPLMYYLFFCHPQVALLHSYVLIGLGLFGIVFPWFNLFHTPRWRKLRVSIFAVMATYPLIMYFHKVMLEGVDNDASTLLEALMRTYYWYLVGLFFYGTRFPECYWPGRFDYLFSSHQVWHCIAFWAAYTWYCGILDHMRFRLTTPCP